MMHKMFAREVERKNKEAAMKRSKSLKLVMPQMLTNNRES
jgi:hypothetical protein